MLHDSNGINIYYETLGDVDDATLPWMVFAHSLACSSAMWKYQVAEFVKDHRVLLFDTRGHGKSDAPATGYAFDDMVADTAGLLDALKIDRPHFVGLSMGGMLAQAFALKHPGRLRSLTVADSVSHWPPEAAAMFATRVETARQQGLGALTGLFMSRWFTPPFHKSNPADVAEIAEMVSTSSVDGYAGCSYSIPRINFTPQLKTIDAPMLIIVGKDDPATTVAMSKQIHQATPGSSLVILDNAAHLSNVEQPAAFNSAIRKFLK